MTDSRTEATFKLYKASYRLEKINGVLKTYAAVFLDEQSSHKTIREYTRRITHCIIPAISKIISIIDYSGKHILPVAAAKIACNRIKRNALKEVVDPNNKHKCAYFQILETYSTKSSKALNPEQNKQHQSSRQSK